MSTDFCAQVLFPHSLRSVVGSINEIQRDLRITLCDGTQDEHSGFRGLVVEARDNFCMVIAYVSADVELAPGIDPSRTQLVVETQVLNTCLKAVSSRHELRMSRRPGETDIELALTEPRPSHAGSTFHVPTLNISKTTMCLGDLQLDYRVELEMSEFRDVVKMARNLQAEHLTIEVLERPNGTSRVVVAAGGSASMRYTFDSLSRSSGDPPPPPVEPSQPTKRARSDTKRPHAADKPAKRARSATKKLRAAEDAAPAEAAEPAEPADEPAEPADDEAVESIVKFSQQFPVDYVHLFIKSVDKSTVEFRLGNDQPLVMSYPLGEHGSSLTFIVAPRG
jgi:hypothetical protein